MVMRADIWGRQSTTFVADSGRRVLAVPTPSGKPLTQEDVRKLARADQIMVACGRYEGIDQRVVDHYRSAGDLTSSSTQSATTCLTGEVAGLVLVESICTPTGRIYGESGIANGRVFEGNVIEYPTYTRPAQWRGLAFRMSCRRQPRGD